MIIKIKKIGVLSLGKIFGILYAFMGLIIGVFITLFALVVPTLFSSNTSGIFGILFGVGAIIFLPIFYGVFGFLSGLIIAVLYNLASSWVGWLEVEIKK